MSGVSLSEVYVFAAKKGDRCEMSNNLLRDNDYKVWLADIKSRIRNVQIKAALKVNTELLNFY